MKLWGQNYTRRELESYTGDLRQIADVRLATLADGLERDVRVAEVRTGSGFDFSVLIDRAMDIGAATYNGIPLAWQSGTGAAHPSRFEPTTRGWLRNFHGGLLALCGLTQAGGAVPGVDPQNGEELGLHGRIGNIPAYDVRIERVWLNDDDWVIRLHGTIDELSLFSYKLRLERTFEFVPGTPAVTIQDKVRNMGGSPAPLMILYHCNFGWPLVSPSSKVISPAKVVEPRDEVAKAGINTWHEMQPPVPDYAEQVFFHEIAPSDNFTTASIVNEPLNLGVHVHFNVRTLGYLTEWKQMGFRDYVLALEPGNCLPEGRVSARNAGRLRMLEPDETQEFEIGFEVFQPQSRETS